MVKKLHKASVAYPNWKLLNNPNYKPWHFPEQIASPRIRIEDVSPSSVITNIEHYRLITFYDKIVIMILDTINLFINCLQCVKSAEEKNSKNYYVDESELKESVTMDSD